MSEEKNAVRNCGHGIRTIPINGREVPVSTARAGRKCKVCGQRLSVYNKKNSCFSHQNSLNKTK